METILGIETSSAELSIALIKNGKPECSFSRYAKNSHSDLITQGVEFILRSADITSDEIDGFAVSTGPGSFTGLRIGISFLKGLMVMKEKPIFPVSSLEVLGACIPVCTGRIAAGFDARKGFLYSALFEKNQGMMTRVTKDEFISFKDFNDGIAVKSHVVIDNMGYKPGFSMKELNKDCKLFTAEDLSVSRGLVCAGIAWANRDIPEKWKDVSSIEPVYMQKSYAEKARLANKRG